MNNDLKNKTIKGLSWNFINQFGVQFINLLFSILLARLLTPTEYGLIAMVTVFTGFSIVLLDFGFGNALIYKDNPTNKDWSSVFWLNAIMGAAICLTLILFSEKIAQFYNEPSLQSITIFLSFNLVLGAMSITQNAKIRKTLNFKSLAIINICSILISGTLGIVLAIMGYGVWSLVFQRITDTFCRFIGLFIISKWLPIYGFSIKSLKEIFNYSIYLFLGNVISYWSRNLDNLLVGKYISSADLGLYNRAYSFLMFPVASISRVVSSVLFPAFSQIKNDIEKINVNFIAITRMVSFIVFPIMFILFLAAHEITYVIFGEQWMEMAPFLKLFSFLGMYQAIVSLNGPLYLALGKTKLNFQISLFTQFTNITGLVVGVNWGINGIIIAIYISSIINFFPVNYFILKSINLSIYNRYKEVSQIFILNITSFFIVYFFTEDFVTDMRLSLGIKVFSYLIIYTVGAKIIKLKELNYLMTHLKRKKSV